MPSPDHINQELGVALVISTLPDHESFERLARSLLDKGVIACANGLPGASSIYRWQGKIESAREVVAIFKTRSELVARVSELIEGEHPYELPEVLAVPVSGGLDGYIEWIKTMTQDASR